VRASRARVSSRVDARQPGRCKQSLQVDDRKIGRLSSRPVSDHAIRVLSVRTGIRRNGMRIEPVTEAESIRSYWNRCSNPIYEVWRPAAGTSRKRKRSNLVPAELAGHDSQMGVPWSNRDPVSARRETLEVRDRQELRRGCPGVGRASGELGLGQVRDEDIHRERLIRGEGDPGRAVFRGRIQCASNGIAVFRQAACRSDFEEIIGTALIGRKDQIPSRIHRNVFRDLVRSRHRRRKRVLVEVEGLNCTPGVVSHFDVSRIGESVDRDTAVFAGTAGKTGRTVTSAGQCLVECRSACARD
jgi:hypothetical protein